MTQFGVNNNIATTGHKLHSTSSSVVVSSTKPSESKEENQKLRMLPRHHFQYLVPVTCPLCENDRKKAKIKKLKTDKISFVVHRQDATTGYAGLDVDKIVEEPVGDRHGDDDSSVHYVCSFSPMSFRITRLCRSLGKSRKNSKQGANFENKKTVYLSNEAKEMKRRFIRWLQKLRERDRMNLHFVSFSSLINEERQPPVSVLLTFYMISHHEYPFLVTILIGREGRGIGLERGKAIWSETGKVSLTAASTFHVAMHSPEKKRPRLECGQACVTDTVATAVTPLLNKMH